MKHINFGSMFTAVLCVASIMGIIKSLIIHSEGLAIGFLLVFCVTIVFLVLKFEKKGNRMKLMHEVRGLRNNNPGNIEKSKAYKWDGEVETLAAVPDENRFCQFSSPDYGIRAIYRILHTYREKYSIHMIESIVQRWAPPIENDTDKYIEQVVENVNYLQECQENITKLTILERKEYPYIVSSIVKHENGFCPFTLEYLTFVFEWAVPEWRK